MFKYYISNKFTFNIGLQPVFNTNATNKYSVDDSKRNILITLGTELSMPIGFSYEWKRFVVDARYNLGLTHIVKDMEIYNSVFHMTLGYRLGE